jgi:hypothetical protein
MLTAERLYEVLRYDTRTGKFFWRITRGSRATAGKEAGTINTPGYLVIRIDGKLYAAHRLAWLYVTGQWPKHSIDHINGSKDDNRFANLRAATHAQNMKNVRMHVDNSSGFKGVFLSGKKWEARIMRDGQRIKIGIFDTIESAAFAYDQAALAVHKDFARINGEGK